MEINLQVELQVELDSEDVHYYAAVPAALTGPGPGTGNFCATRPGRAWGDCLGNHALPLRLLNELTYVIYYFGCARTLTPSLSTIFTVNSGMCTKNLI